MFRRFVKSAFFVTCELPLVTVLVVSPAFGQQLPAPTPADPVVIGETPAAVPPATKPRAKSAALPEPYLLPGQDPNPGADAVAPRDRPSLGIVAEERADRTGLTVLSVRELSPAAQAGLLKGDVLTKLNDQQTTTIEDVASALSALQAGDPVSIEVSRSGQFFELRSTMSDAPPPAVDAVPDRGASETRNPPMEQGRAALGVTVEDSSPNLSGAPALRGARVVAVAASSPAESIGIRPGDTIVSIDGQVMYGARELTEYMRSARAGDSVEIGYYQDRVLRRKAITLGGSRQPLPESTVEERMMQPGIVIRPGANVGEILQDVGRSIDSFLGPRAPRQVPRPAPMESFATPAAPPVLAPQPIETPAPRKIPTPDSNPTSEGIPPVVTPNSDDASEVVRLRKQVQELMERMKQLEKQVQQAEPKPPADDE
ncbi:putative periplasmic serine endoprotease DegP-like precursor [Rosistilla carotiformis]|uniref:Putative periplasmic serine endoprotease DegP-like n=1 Tax=Rosistilla carotiformis TaxID=2528017 RepID=A0A518JW11_9BACT|nr:PDZ domain-containing protein [Rosistilla carotiformis]QDV69730.1 putative periplasmic serine endoprotease DegP-like precursor [Rosistilla carotiformis]